VKLGHNNITQLFLVEARTSFDRILKRIVACLRLLNDEEIWWRPNAASNSAGNLVLHLSGNMRQWIVSGLGGAPDLRLRDAEFSEAGPIPRRVLVAQLTKTVREVGRVLRSLPPQSLARNYRIQGFRVTGLVAVSHVYQHFSHHAGQIIYISKLLRRRDLRLTKLPSISKTK
jgi:uncharacterized damage-inducible protein DinB